MLLPVTCNDACCLLVVFVVTESYVETMFLLHITFYTVKLFIKRKITSEATLFSSDKRLAQNKVGIIICH